MPEDFSKLVDVAAQALVQAFGSDEELKLLEAWRKVILGMLHCDRLIKMGLEHDVDENPRFTFSKLQTREREAREPLARQVSNELGHRKPEA